MPAAARALGVDRILTGHGCSATASIAGLKNTKVFIQGTNGAVAGDNIGGHSIRAGKYCIPHGAIINSGSTKVSYSGFPAARVGDSADMGTIISGSPKVIIGG